MRLAFGQLDPEATRLLFLLVWDISVATVFLGCRNYKQACCVTREGEAVRRGGERIRGRLIEWLTYALSIQLLERPCRNKSSGSDVHDDHSRRAGSLSLQTRLEYTRLYYVTVVDSLDHQEHLNCRSDQRRRLFRLTYLFKRFDYARRQMLLLEIRGHERVYFNHLRSRSFSLETLNIL